MTGVLLAVAIVAMAAGCDAAMGPLHRAAMTGDAEFVRSWIAHKRSLDVSFDDRRQASKAITPEREG